MSVAVLGWGSRIWQNSTLVCDGKSEKILNVKKMAWNKDGPELPLEFCRVSENGRVTLVISEKYGVDLQTLWTISAEADIDKARKNLASREGQLKNGESKIFSLSQGKKFEIPDNCDADVRISFGRVHSWLQKHPDLTGVVWTGLESRWVKKKPSTFTRDQYPGVLREYLLEKRSDLETFYIDMYFQNAPAIIDTPGRNVFNSLRHDSAAQFGRHCLSRFLKRWLKR